MNRDFAKNFETDVLVGKPLTKEAFRNAQRRHNDIVHAAKKRNHDRRFVERAIEDTEYFVFPKREEALMRLNQPGRWTKHPGYGKANWKKENFRASIQNKFDRIDAAEEERYLKRCDNFAHRLVEQEIIANEADELLDEFEEQCFRNGMLQASLYDACVPFADFNNYKVIYFVDNDVVEKFRCHMAEEGASLWSTPPYDETWKTVHVMGVRTFRKPGLIIEKERID